MSLFSKPPKQAIDTKDMAKKESPETEVAREEEPVAPPEPDAEQTHVYDEEGYDEHGFDRDGYTRSGYDAKGYRRDIGEPLNTSKKLEDEILKYRRANGYYEYEMAVYANFPDLKDNFEANREDVAELFYNLFLIDEAHAIRLWKWLLSTFEGTLSEPANSYRLVSGILYSLEQRNISLDRLLPYLQKDEQLSRMVFEKSSYVDRRHALLLAACITKNEYELFQTFMDFIRANPYLGQEEALAADKILKTVIEEVPSPAMTHEGCDLLTKNIKKSVKMMMRKVLFKLLDEKMEYLLKEEKRKEAEAQRAARLEQQKKKLEEERQSRQKDVGARQRLRNTKKKFGELKLAALEERRADPFFEGGRFIDFQQLEGTMVALKAHPEIPDSVLPGDRMELVREPDYLKDPMAIAVTDADGMKIGYIPNHSNTFPALLMDDGKEIFGRLYSIGSEDEESLQICVELFLVD